MKHSLLILISLLILSSPVIGNNHKGETRFLRISQTGGWGENQSYYWDKFGDKDNHPKYQGQVKNGKPHGVGTVVYPSGRKYEGEWKNGEIHGHGTMTSKGVWKYGDYYGGVFIKFVGVWRYHSLWRGTYYENGNLEYKIVNGEYIKQ